VKRQERELARLAEVLALIEHAGCQVRRLGEHFGEELGRNCGHCSWCLSGATTVLPSQESAAIDSHVIQRGLALARQRAEVFPDPVALARFLCGVSSPAIARARLSSHELFGSLDQAPFQELAAKLGRLWEG
jgi:ATP-dependent DNA helicase RecQ